MSLVSKSRFVDVFNEYVDLPAGNYGDLKVLMVCKTVGSIK